ncbi:hypothetical protein AB0395_21895 [Streptosporangium sp. NPDC051023]|uniref:hypothetical protein n=1 Tax=Streptosporangium sp. NPDC051023 TaxID=3155410 RepID=UPI00344CE7A7
MATHPTPPDGLPVPVTANPDDLVPILEFAGPYRMRWSHLPGDPDIAVIKTFVPIAGNGRLAVWAVARGDGRALYGWYRAERTDTVAAVLEAMRRILEFTPPRHTITLVTQSQAAAAVADRLAHDGGVWAIRKVPLHALSLRNLAYELWRRPIPIETVDNAAARSAGPILRQARGMADRLAWTAVQLALNDIAVDAPAVQRWMASEPMRLYNDHGSLRRAWNSSGNPGYALGITATDGRAGIGYDRRSDATAWYPLHDSLGPYSLHLEGLDGDAHVIATDASIDNRGAGENRGIGAWAAVRGDGRAWFGWYTADRTNAVSAELAAMSQALATYRSSGSIHLLVDSASAASIGAQLTEVRALPLISRGALHQGSLLNLRRSLATHRVHIEQVTGPQGKNKRSPHHPLIGMADRMAWSALQFARDGIDPREEEAMAWMRSLAVRHGSWRSKLRASYQRWRAETYPGADDAST